MATGTGTAITCASDAQVRITPLAGGVGAEISHVDLNQPLGAPAAQAIRDAWVRHGLVVFRNQDIDDAAHMRLSEVFGEMEPSAVSYINDPSNTYMMVLEYDPATAKKNAQNYNVGGIDRASWLGWHWDQSFMPTIVRGAVLRMTHPSECMGETGLIDAIAAYDRLDDAMKRRIDSLEVVYQYNPDFGSGQFGFPGDIRPLPLPDGMTPGGWNLDFPPVVHPLAITQMETGRKVLKLSPMHARYVLGMERAESDALLTELAEHLCDLRHAYFHKWDRNQIIVWDNWRMIHMACGVPLDVERRGRRTTIMGDYKVGRYLDPELDRNRDVVRLAD